MSLTKRITDVLRAHLHSAVSQAEDPELMLNLNMEDAQEGLRQAKVAVHTAITVEKELQQQWDAAAADVALWNSRAELAAKQQKSDWVRQAVEEKRKAQRRMEDLKEPLAAAKAKTAAYKDKVQAFEDHIQEAAHEKDSLIARAKMARATKATDEALAGIQTADPTSGFNTARQKIQHMEAEAAASDELLHTHRSDLEDQFKSLESEGSKESVDAEVEALMAKSQGQAAQA